LVKENTRRPGYWPGFFFGTSLVGASCGGVEDDARGKAADVGMNSADLMHGRKELGLKLLGK